MSETLSLSEAVDLCAAWAQEVVLALNCRAFFIKGHSASAFGIRPPRQSSDVDLWVEPDAFDAFCRRIESHGWEPRKANLAARLTTTHSLSYIKDGWPCDLDVHRDFPGFLKPSSEVFDALWDERRVLVIANRECTFAGPLGSILILALHALRATPDIRASYADLDHISRLELESSEVYRLSALAKRTGSEHTLAAVLENFGASAYPDDKLYRSQLFEWNRRVQLGSTEAYYWILAWRRATWRQRAELVREVVWPAGESLGVKPGPRSTLGRNLVRLTRAARAARSLVALATMVRTVPAKVYRPDGDVPWSGVVLGGGVDVVDVSDGRVDHPHDLSATLQSDALTTGENEATQTDWVGDLGGRLGIDSASGRGRSSATTGREAIRYRPVDGR